MGRILAIDVGTRTLGLAVSDEAQRFALPLMTLRRAGLEHDLRQLDELIRERGVAEAVVGLPLNLDGSPGRMEQEAELVARELGRRCGIPVHRWDERLTTVAAERALLEADVSRRKRKLLVDKVAATLMLQAFLDRRLLGRGAGT